MKYPCMKNPERHICDLDISGVINHLAMGNFTTEARLMVQHEHLMEAFKPIMKVVIEKERQRLWQRRERFVLWKLLKGMFHLDAEERLTPRQVLEHPFITLAHMTDFRDISFQ